MKLYLGGCVNQFLRKSGLISAAVLLLFFQNCSPTGFEVMSSVNQSSTGGSGTGSVINPTPTPNPTTPRQPGTTTPPTVVTPTPTPTPSTPTNPGTTTPQPVSETWMVVNNIGESGGSLATHQSAVFESTFPFLKSYQSFDKAKNLYLLVPQRYQGKSAEVCVSSSATGCDNASAFRKHTLSIASTRIPGYTGAVIEDFYKPYWLKDFGNFYLFVNVEGESRSILVQHRAYLPKNIAPDPEQFYFEPDDKSYAYTNMHYFYSSGKSENRAYGFSCGAPTNAGVGWAAYSYGRLGSATSSSCYYRILNREQALTEAVRIQIKKYGDNPSLRISCSGDPIQHQKVTCLTVTSTPLLLQPRERWYWQIGEEALVSFGDRINLGTKELGKQSIRLLAYNHSGTQLISSNTIEFTVKENTKLNGQAQNGEIRILCDSNVKVGAVGSCHTISYHGTLASQKDSWVWRVNNSRAALAQGGNSYKFIASKAGSHTVFLEAVDDSGRVLKSNTVTVQVTP